MADFSPTRLELDLIKPSPNTLKVDWTLNGAALTGNVDFVSVSANTINKGTNTVTAVVQDASQLLRVNGHETNHAYSVSWTIENTISGTSANLSALAISEGTLSPPFDPGTISYTSSVQNGTSSISVTPTTEDATATLSINGAAISSGPASSPISLKPGNNTIVVEVAAQDGLSHQTNTLNSVREGGSGKTAPDITFPNESRTYSTEIFELKASSNSTGAISFQLVEEQTENYPGDITLSGTDNGNVAVIKSGKVRLRANVAEEENFLSGTSEMELTINKAAAHIEIRELNHEFDGEPKPAAVSTEPANLTTEVLYNGSSTEPLAVGEYEVSAVIVDDNFAGEATAILTIHTPTAVFDPELAKKIKLYPNPTTGKARVEFKETGQEMHVRVMDMSGHLISQGYARESYEVNLEGLAAGMYFISIQSKGKTVVAFKLEKQ